MAPWRSLSVTTAGTSAQCWREFWGTDGGKATLSNHSTYNVIFMTFYQCYHQKAANLNLEDGTPSATASA